MASTNQFKGLPRGPIDHKSSSVINQVSAGSIDMGSVVVVSTTITSGETLPRVSQVDAAANTRVYGVAVGGDVDGIYGDGTASVDDSTRATNAAGQGVVVVTQGRCLARVFGGSGAIAIGDALTTSTDLTGGVLAEATTGQTVIARALGIIGANNTDIIPVDVQREGAAV